MTDTDPLYFIRDGLHTALMLPRHLLLQRIPQLADHLGGGGWIQIGWGDFHYYGANEHTCPLAARALLVPSPAVAEALALDNFADGLSPQARIYPLNIARSHLPALLDYIGHYYPVDANGHLQLVRTNRRGSKFFRSRGIYLWANTCNTWLARAMKLAGLNLQPALILFPDQMERAVRKNGFLPIA